MVRIKLLSKGVWHGWVINGCPVRRIDLSLSAWWLLLKSQTLNRIFFNDLLRVNESIRLARRQRASSLVTDKFTHWQPFVLHFHGERENAATVFAIRVYFDRASIHPHQILADHQPHTNTITIDFCSAFQLPKHVKKLWHVLRQYTFASVVDMHS